HPRLEIARLVELLVEPARAKRFGIGRELVAFAPLLESGNRGLGRQHAGLDRRVAALDARGVEEAGLVADQHAAREGEARQRLQAARGDRPRSIGDALSAFEEGADRRMRLESLES